jgi:hypothetical protein
MRKNVHNANKVPKHTPHQGSPTEPRPLLVPIIFPQRPPLGQSWSRYDTPAQTAHEETLVQFPHAVVEERVPSSRAPKSLVDSRELSVQRIR